MIPLVSVPMTSATDHFLTAARHGGLFRNPTVNLEMLRQLPKVPGDVACRSPVVTAQLRESLIWNWEIVSKNLFHNCDFMKQQPVFIRNLQLFQVCFEFHIIKQKVYIVSVFVLDFFVDLEFQQFSFRSGSRNFSKPWCAERREVHWQRNYPNPLKKEELEQGSTLDGLDIPSGSNSMRETATWRFFWWIHGQVSSCFWVLLFKETQSMNNKGCCCCFGKLQVTSKCWNFTWQISVLYHRATLGAPARRVDVTADFTSA